MVQPSQEIPSKCSLLPRWCGDQSVRQHHARRAEGHRKGLQACRRATQATDIQTQDNSSHRHQAAQYSLLPSQGGRRDEQELKLQARYFSRQLHHESLLHRLLSPVAHWSHWNRSLGLLLRLEERHGHDNNRIARSSRLFSPRKIQPSPSPLLPSPC